MNCKICNKEFDKDEAERIYGLLPCTNGCCRPQCYTKLMMGEKKMKKYLFIMEQHGEGCDYTIGCGMTTKVIEADSMDDALEKLTHPEGPDEYTEYLDGDYELKTLKGVELDNVHNINLEILKKKYEQKKEDEKLTEEKRKEKEEYLRLKEKFGDEA